MKKFPVQITTVPVDIEDKECINIYMKANGRHANYTMPLSSFAANGGRAKIELLKAIDSLVDQCYKP